MAFESVLSQLDQNVSIGGAQARYEASPSAKALPNPLLVDEEIAYYKETFSKLKFEYLEQETRDRFLRYVLLKELYDVQPQDFDAITASNETLKASLKSLKEEINSTVAVNEGLLEEVMELHRVYEKRSSEVFGYIKESEQIDAQLDSLINGNKDDQVLLNLQKAVRDSSVGDLNQFMELSQSVLEQEANRFETVSKDVKSKEQELEQKKQHIQWLEEKLALLELQLAKIKDKNVEDDENRLLAQKLKTKYDILSRLSGLDLDLSRSGQRFLLTVQGVKFLLDEDFHVLEVNDSRTGFRRWIEEVNGSGNEQARMQKLGSLLGKFQQGLS